jgi:hypothetical protein
MPAPDSRPPTADPTGFHFYVALKKGRMDTAGVAFSVSNAHGKVLRVLTILNLHDLLVDRTS